MKAKKIEPEKCWVITADDDLAYVNGFGDPIRVSTFSAATLFTDKATAKRYATKWNMLGWNIKFVVRTVRIDFEF